MKDYVLNKLDYISVFFFLNVLFIKYDYKYPYRTIEKGKFSTILSIHLSIYFSICFLHTLYTFVSISAPPYSTVRVT